MEKERLSCWAPGQESPFSSDPKGGEGPGLCGRCESMIASSRLGFDSFPAL